MPSSWRGTMEDPSTMSLLFDIYSNCEPPSSTLALEALVMLGSLRRSLFSSDDERQAFLVRMMNGDFTPLKTCDVTSLD